MSSSETVASSAFTALSTESHHARVLPGGTGRVVDVDALRPGELLADWILFATALDGSWHAVQCEPFLSSRLPLTISRGSHVLAVRPLAGTLHAEVR
ncbi:hypothetical protein ACXC9Q_11075 [Kribbella sp. CWNU-51]